MTKSDYRKMLNRWVGKMKEGISPERSIRENMILAYRKSFPEKGEDEAAQVADGILGGIRDFHDNLSAYQQEGMQAVFQVIDKAMEGKTDNEKYAMYLNTIVVIKSMDQGTLEKLFGSSRFQVDTTFQELKGAEIGSDVMVTEEMLSEAREQLAKALESSVITLNDIEALAAIPQDQMETYVQDFAIGNWDSEERKAYLALAAYLAYKEGELTIQEETDPYSWAAVMAAAVETEKTVREASAGRLTWEMASRTLKGIGMVLLAMGMGYAIWVASGMLISMVGMAAGLLNQLVVSAVGIWIIVGMWKTHNEPIKWFCAGVDRVKEFLESHYEPIKEGIFSAFRFIRDKVMAGYAYVRNGVGNLLSHDQAIEI